ncbi:MAG: RIP metalloprotease RseP, partial [Clostridia bacterium]|nr:RIP metalloprotease RseP [Clostridia bacterium]
MNLLTLTSSAVFSKILYVLVAVLFFGVIIFIHEFGHFIFAKLFKVKVNEFAIGMGPAIFKKQGKVTKYTLRLLPIGGYNSMEGEDESSEDEGAFCNKAVWKRIIIVAAGGIFNIILGFIICVVFIGSGELVGTSTVNQFYEGAVSCADGGIQSGDKILKIDGKRVFSDYDISFLMQRANTGRYSFTVERNGEKIILPEVNFATRTGGNFAFNEDNSISDLGQSVKKGGLRENDIIIAVNGVKVKTNDELRAEIDKDRDYTVSFTVERDGEAVECADVKMSTVTVFDFTVLGEERNVLNVMAGAAKYGVSLSRMVYLSLIDMISGKYGLSDLSGPIGTIDIIADVAQTSAEETDYSYLFMIMALITINIGLMNLLPIPALDGGRLLFMFIEVIFRKPVPKK